MDFVRQQFVEPLLDENSSGGDNERYEKARHPECIDNDNNLDFWKGGMTKPGTVVDEVSMDRKMCNLEGELYQDVIGMALLLLL